MKNKFRYHHKEDGWVYIDFIEDNIAKAMEGYEYRPHCSQLYQSTGKKDTNGVEIYEGAILSVAMNRNANRKESKHDGYVTGRALVEWNQEDCSFILKTRNEFNKQLNNPVGQEQYNRHVWNEGWHSVIEVIGDSLHDMNLLEAEKIK